MRMNSYSKAGKISSQNPVTITYEKQLSKHTSNTHGLNLTRQISIPQR